MSMFSDFPGQAHYMQSVFPLVKPPTEGLPWREVSGAVGQQGGMGREGGHPVHSQERGREEVTSWRLCKYLGMDARTSHSFQIFPTQDEAWRLKRIIQIDLPGHGSTIGRGGLNSESYNEKFCTSNPSSGGFLGQAESWGGRGVRRQSCVPDRAFQGNVFQSQPIFGKRYYYSLGKCLFAMLI